MGGILRKATPIPFKAPTRAPPASSTGKSQSVLELLPLAQMVSSTADAFSTHGMDRSTPPLRMTNVWPTATRAINEASINNWSMWDTLRNPVAATSPNTASTITST